MEPSLPPATDSSRRVWARYPSTRPLPRQLSAGADNLSLDAWILDLSAGGIGLLVDRPLDEGTLLLVELETCPTAAPVRAWANVVRCRNGDNGDFRVGCRFVTPLEDGDLECILQ